MTTSTGPKTTIALLGLLLAAAAPRALAIDIRLCTSQGIVDVELDERNAPRHARNFVNYAEDGFYAGTVIHRVVPDSMVQAGAYALSLERRRPGAPIASESGNGLSNLRGTIAASRGEDPDSASSQFFFNLADNTHLDATPGSPGYTVFGRVTNGIETLDRISRLPTGRRGELSEIPVPLVEIESVTILERASPFGISVERDPAALESAFETADASGDAEAVLEAVDALRRACTPLDGEQYLAEAESALQLGRVDRARYGLEQYLARASALDPLLRRAQRLYAGLPTPDTSNFEEHIAHCERPAAPTIPDARFADRETLQSLEPAIQRYRQLGERYVGCVAQVIDGGELSEREAIDATHRHNEVVAELTAAVTRYNRAVRAFRESSSQPPSR